MFRLFSLGVNKTASPGSGSGTRPAHPAPEALAPGELGFAPGGWDSKEAPGGDWPSGGGGRDAIAAPGGNWPSRSAGGASGAVCASVCARAGP